MSKASIDYMNARRALMPASGGTNYAKRHRVEYAPECEADPADVAMAAIGAFSLWAETTRQVQAERLGIPQSSETEIPF